MTVSYNPSSVINGLLLNLDLANPKSYQTQENLFTNSENQANSGVYGNSSLFQIQANTATTVTPIGTTASNLVIHNSTTSNYSFLYQSYTTTATGYYTLSYYIKPYNTATITLILGTNGFYPYSPGGTTYSTVKYNGYTNTFYNQGYASSTTNFNTIADYTYGSSPGPNGWTRVWMTANLTTATGIANISGGFYVGESGQTSLWYGLGVYTWGWQLESSNTANTYISTQASVVPKNTALVDMIGRNVFTVANSNFVSNNSNGYLQFHRYPATTSTTKYGGLAYLNSPTGALNVANFLYSDHTWEIWARIDDINPSTIPGDPTEGSTVLAVYPGYHSGFIHGSTTLSYYIWNTVTSVAATTWTIGTSGQQINQGQWAQIVVTRIGNTFTPYLNGQQIGTGSVLSGFTSSYTYNQIMLGAVGPSAPGVGAYRFYSKSSMSIVRMYNRGLSLAEIQQNFNANRGRYGL